MGADFARVECRWLFDWLRQAAKKCARNSALMDRAPRVLGARGPIQANWWFQWRSLRSLITQSRVSVQRTD